VVGDLTKFHKTFERAMAATLCKAGKSACAETADASVKRVIT